MSLQGRKLLEEREGLDLKASLSGIPNDPWTIGYGHTHFDGPPIPVKGMAITEQEADDMLTKDLARYENIVNHSVTVPLEQNEFDALVSLCYNVEVALSFSSSIVKSLNKGDKQSAAKAILRYNKPKEIMGRRKQEYNQFLTPYKENINMTTVTISIAQRNAAFDAVKPLVMQAVPEMFHSYVTDALILSMTDAALNAAFGAK